MISNYLKTASRSLVRHKGYTLINITGLAIGIAACLVLFLVVRYELSYDKFQPSYSRIGRVITQDKFSDGITYNSGVPVPALEVLRTQMPDISFGSLLSSFGSQVTVLTDDKASAQKMFIEETGVFFSDAQFFNVFSYKWLSGEPGVLSKPNTIVLTKKMAEKYFGHWENAPGKLLKLDNILTFEVAGVLENVPGSTDFPLAVMASIETLRNNSYNYNYYPDWNSTSSNYQVYALLPDGKSIETVNAQLAKFSQEHYKGRGNSEKSNFLQPLSALHFDRRFEIFGDHVTDRSSLKVLTLIGLFIIVMACINFINLSTAQAVGRSKEVGVRKVLGGNRKQLFAQVMGETALLVLMAGVVAVGIATLCLPSVKHIAFIHEELSLFDPQLFLFLLGLLVVVTVLSGLYPALIVSGFKPVLALKNKLQSATVAGVSLRRGLVVLQFAISQVLIIGTIIAVTQMNFIKNADLGFNKEAVLVILGNNDSTSLRQLSSFKQSLLQIPDVQTVSFSSDVPSSDNTWSSNFAFNHKSDEPFMVTMKFADEDYFDTYDLQLVAGRKYEKSDTMKEVVINETLMQKLGIKNPGEVVGKDIRIGGGSWKPVVGVVKDFKTNSLRETVKPLLVGQRNQYYVVSSVKLRSSNIPKAQEAIQSVWDRHFPEYAYSASFMEDNINRFYRQENQLSLLYKIFAALAILISSLGLYGLVSFMAVQKVKEVGIRKVLGASAMNIVYLFSKEFSLLIAISFLIAAPLAYWMMTNWLQDFAYRIEPGVWVFILAIIISMLIAWITVGYKAIRAAVADPVKSLRSE